MRMTEAYSDTASIAPGVDDGTFYMIGFDAIYSSNITDSWSVIINQPPPIASANVVSFRDATSFNLVYSSLTNSSENSQINRQLQCKITSCSMHH